MGKVVVIGSSNMDLVICVPRIPAVGETIIGGNSEMIFGGKGANQAVAAKRAGGEIVFISKLGMDSYGASMKAHFIEEGLPDASLLSDENYPSGIAQIWVSEKGENSIVVAPGSNMQLRPEDLKPFEDEIANASFVLVQLEIPLKTVEHIAELVASSNAKLILNPAPAQVLSSTLLANTFLLTPNESEAELLTGIKIVDDQSAEKAGEILLSRGVKEVIITLGEKGCLWINENGAQSFPTLKVDAIDSTAAGDVFNGALAVGLADGKSISKAIPFASVAAAISVTRKGAQPSAPSKMEIEQALEGI